MRLAAILIVWLIAIAALAASEHHRQNEGLPLIKAAAPRHPVAWRLNSVCTIDEHQSTEKIA